MSRRGAGNRAGSGLREASKVVDVTLKDLSSSPQFHSGPSSNMVRGRPIKGYVSPYSAGPEVRADLHSCGRIKYFLWPVDLVSFKRPDFFFFFFLVGSVL